MAARGRGIVPVRGLRRMVTSYAKEPLEELAQGAFTRLVNVLEAKAVELAPVDTGDLESSSTVTVALRGGTLKGTVAFTAPHAAAAHELPPEARGPRTQAKPGNEYGLAGRKYLERPLRGFQKLLPEEMGRALQALWRGAPRGK